MAGKTFELFQGWKYRIDSPRTGEQSKRHIHVYRNGEEYAQNDDGTSHDGSNRNPPQKIIIKLKQKKVWDWKSDTDTSVNTEIDISTEIPQTDKVIMDISNSRAEQEMILLGMQASGSFWGFIPHGIPIPNIGWLPFFFSGPMPVPTY